MRGVRAGTGKPTRTTFSAVAVLAVFSMHNAFNCFAFLSFADYTPAKEIFHDSGHGTDEDVGFINTMGWVGILSTLPVVSAVESRGLLVAAGLANTGAPVLRYLGARASNYPMVVAAQFLQGAAFGVIGAWPALLARLQWPAPARTIVTAVASLSNYIGGAIGVVVMPSIAPSGTALVAVLLLQCYVAAGLFGLMPVFGWIPSGAGAAANSSREAGRRGNSVGLAVELRTWIGWREMAQIGTFGLVIGISLLIQGIVQFLLHEFGFSNFVAGVCNSAYQATAVLTGVGLGGAVSDALRLRGVLCGLHAVYACAIAALAAVCYTSFAGRDVVVVLVMALLGASLMGMLPFALQQAVHTIAPVSENVVCGLIYLVAISIAAGGTYLMSSISATISAAIIAGLVVVSHQQSPSLATLSCVHSTANRPVACTENVVGKSETVIIPRHRSSSAYSVSNIDDSIHSDQGNPGLGYFSSCTPILGLMSMSGSSVKLSLAFCVNQPLRLNHACIERNINS